MSRSKTRPLLLQVRLSPREKALLQTVAARWTWTEAEVIRWGIETAAREANAEPVTEGG